MIRQDELVEAYRACLSGRDPAVLKRDALIDAMRWLLMSEDKWRRREPTTAIVMAFLDSNPSTPDLDGWNRDGSTTMATGFSCATRMFGGHLGHDGFAPEPRRSEGAASHAGRRTDLGQYRSRGHGRG